MLRSSRSSSGRCSSEANVEALNRRSGATRLPWQSRSPPLLIIHRRSDASSFSTLIPRGNESYRPDIPGASRRCSSKENEHDQWLHASRHHHRAGGLGRDPERRTTRLIHLRPDLSSSSTVGCSLAHHGQTGAGRLRRFPPLGRSHPHVALERALECCLGLISHRIRNRARGHRRLLQFIRRKRHADIGQ
jgi:hypothetical protein